MQPPSGKSQQSPMQFPEWSVHLISSRAATGARPTQKTSFRHFPVGLLARSTNSGKYQQNQFAVLPEVGATFRYRLLPRLEATIGYHFLYWSRVARAGDQIDLALDLAEPFSGAPLPRFSFEMTDFWAQGLDFGLEYRF